jgi:hypothetical protein
MYGGLLNFSRVCFNKQTNEMSIPIFQLIHKEKEHLKHEESWLHLLAAL